MTSSSYSSLYIPLVAVVGRLPVVEGDAFPRDNDNLTLVVALSLLPCIRLYKEIALCIDGGGNGSSLPDVAVIWQVAPISSLHIPLVAVVGRLPVLE